MLTCFKIHSTGLYTLQTCLYMFKGSHRSKVKLKVKGQVKGQRSNVKGQVKGQRSKVKGQRSKVKSKVKGQVNGQVKCQSQIIRLKPLKCKFFQFRIVYTNREINEYLRYRKYTNTCNYTIT